MALDAILGEVPQLDVVELDVRADLDEAKEPLRIGATRQSGGRLALIVIHDDAVVKPEDQERFGNYDLFVKESSTTGSRTRSRAGTGSDRGLAGPPRRSRPGGDRALTSVGRVRSRTVTEEGEKETNEILNALMPMAFMLLLFVSVLSGGQYLMTTTIEDKSSRVVEVLLSAVSPMQLMTGKIIGQMCVGLRDPRGLCGDGFREPSSPLPWSGC